MSRWKLFLIIAIALVSVYIGIRYVVPYLLPFILAVILSIALEPVVSLFSKKIRMPRGIAVAMAMLTVFGLAGLVIVLSISRLVVELRDISTFLPQLSKEVQVLLESSQGEITHLYWSLPDPFLTLLKSNLEGLRTVLDNLLQALQGYTSTVLNKFLGIIAALPNVLIIVLLTAVATFFMARDRTMLINFWRRIMPAPWGEHSLDVTRDVIEAFKGYVRAQAILITITGLQTLIGLYLLGIDYALTMALIVAFMDILPILGPSSVFVPWIIWLMVIGNFALAWKLALLLILLLSVRQVLEAKVVADQLGLHPLATLFSMYVGLQLLGIVGFLIGPFVVISIKAMHKAGIIKI